MFLIAAAVVAVAFLLAWLLPERPLRRTIETSEGIGEAFAAPTIGDSLRELSRQLAVAAGRERSRDFIARMATRAEVDLDPLACWMLGRVDDGTIRDPVALAARASVDGHELAAAVAELRAAGFVTDDTGPATLTPAGIDALGRLRVAWREELRSLVADWEPESDPELSPLIARLAEELADRPGARPRLTRRRFQAPRAPPRVRACPVAIPPTTAWPGSTWSARCSACAPWTCSPAGHLQPRRLSCASAARRGGQTGSASRSPASGGCR